MSKLVAAFTLSGRRELDVCTGEGSREGDDVGRMPTFGGWPHAQSTMRLMSMRAGGMLICLMKRSLADDGKVQGDERAIFVPNA